MNIEQVAAIVKDISYKPGWVSHVYVLGDSTVLYYTADVTCIYTGEQVTLTGTHSVIGPWMSRGELVRTAYRAILSLEMHELQERFRYKGVRVFNPHISMDALLEHANTEEPTYG